MNDPIDLIHRSQLNFFSINIKENSLRRLVILISAVCILRNRKEISTENSRINPHINILHEIFMRILKVSMWRFQWDYVENSLEASTEESNMGKYMICYANIWFIFSCVIFRNIFLILLYKKKYRNGVSRGCANLTACSTAGYKCCMKDFCNYALSSMKPANSIKMVITSLSILVLSKFQFETF